MAEEAKKMENIKKSKKIDIKKDKITVKQYFRNFLIPEHPGFINIYKKEKHTSKEWDKMLADFKIMSIDEINKLEKEKVKE